MFTIIICLGKIWLPTQAEFDGLNDITQALTAGFDGNVTSHSRENLDLRIWDDGSASRSNFKRRFM